MTTFRDGSPPSTSAAIGGPAIDEYVRCYSAPGAWRAGVGYYRALFEDIEQNRAHTAKRIQTPVLAIGGEAGLGEMMEQMMRTVADDVTGRVIPNCGHYVPKEAPEHLAEILLRFQN
jgi:pimeloyl-ACP methyl ester carboxylesterase